MTDEQTAAAIVADYRNACDETAMEAAIVRALRAARTPPAGHIIDDQGVVRKLLAPLVYTESGAVAWMEHVPPPREAAEAAKEAKKCYPFSTETCQRPECKCREEKEAKK